MRVFFSGGGALQQNNRAPPTPHATSSETNRHAEATLGVRKFGQFSPSWWFSTLKHCPLKWETSSSSLFFSEVKNISSGHLETGCHHLGHQLIGPGNRCSFWPPKKGAVDPPVGPDGFSLLHQEVCTLEVWDPEIWQFGQISLPIAIPCVWYILSNFTYMNG